MSNLSAAMERLRLDDGASSMSESGIDDILFREAPRKRAKQEPEQIKADLEDKYLTPSTRFSAEWLDRLQQYVG